MGETMFIVGMVLFALNEHVAPYMRFLLPLPPISVAAYSFALNRISEAGALTGAPTFGGEIKGLVLQTTIDMVAFLGVVILMVLVFSVTNYLIESLSSHIYFLGNLTRKSVQ